MWSISSCGTRVVHQVVMVVRLLRRTPPLRYTVGHRGRRLLELGPVATEPKFIVHYTITTDICEVRLIVVRRRGRSFVGFLVVRIEVFVVEAF